MVNLRGALILLAAVFAIGLFSPEISDSDFWWHLKTGQFIVEHHALPVPDPFAYTTALASPAYPGEEATRHFNLTHEWLSQVLVYFVYRAGGLAGVVLLRALLLAVFCACAGLIVWRRTRNFYASLAVALATAAVARGFTLDRPYLWTFLLLALTILILDSNRHLWLLPPLFLFWANCHGGFFLGWIAIAAYSAETLLRRRPDRTLYLAGASAILLSGVNPNGFHIIQILFYYRQSFLTSRLLEWQRPGLWPPGVFSVMLTAAAGTLIWARQKVRLADWLLFAAFAAAAITAQRNIILIGFLAPILVISYLPVHRMATWAALAAASACAIFAGVSGGVFQFRAAEWQLPSGAADFLLAHHVSAPLFNTYEYGGYLMWRLWPAQRVFIDGRALSESLFQDYVRILYNHDESGGPSADQLLDRYGVQAIVMNGFEYTNGIVYLLAPALADPRQTAWKLVYSDSQSLIFMRQPPPGMTPLDSLGVLDHLEAECSLHLDHRPQYARCARALGDVFGRIHDYARARRWVGIYLAHTQTPDPEAQDAYRRLLGAGQ